MQAVVDGLKEGWGSPPTAQGCPPGAMWMALNTIIKVNRDTIPPSMLLEMGFATNEANRREITGHAQEYAQAVVQATLKFLGRDYTLRRESPNPSTKTISPPRAGEMPRNSTGVYHITLNKKPPQSGDGTWLGAFLDIG